MIHAARGLIFGFAIFGVVCAAQLFACPTLRHMAWDACAGRL